MIERSASDKKVGRRGVPDHVLRNFEVSTGATWLGFSASIGFEGWTRAYSVLNPLIVVVRFDLYLMHAIVPPDVLDTVHCPQ